MSETSTPDAPEGVPAEGVSTDAENTVAQAAETSDTTAPENETPADDAGAEPPKRESKGVQKRIDELTARAYRAERQAEEVLSMLRQQMAGQGQQQPQGPAPLPPELANAMPPAPKPEDFPAGEFDPKYAVALAKHEMRMEQAQAMVHQQKLQRQQAAQQLQANLAQQVERLAATDPQARDSIAALGMRLPNAVADMVADAGADIAYYIARNPEAEKQIAEARTPAAVARALGRIEERLAAAPPPAPPQPTKAPPPPQRAVRGTSAASGEPDINNTEAWIEWRRRQRDGG